MMRIETIIPNPFVSTPKSSSPYPLWWGLKLTRPNPYVGWTYFQPVSIMMRIETAVVHNQHRRCPSSSPYPLWWGLKLAYTRLCRPWYYSSSPYPLWWGLKRLSDESSEDVDYFQPVSIMMRIETQAPMKIRSRMMLPARIHYDEDWNSFLPTQKVHFALLPARIHYDEDWNFFHELSFYENERLPARIHYDEDWNPSFPGNGNAWYCFQPVSIMMRIETCTGRHILAGLRLPARIHYDEDWNLVVRPVIVWVFSSSPYPLWWGLKLCGSGPGNFSNDDFQPVSIMMRIETSLKLEFRVRHTRLPARIHYDEDWNWGRPMSSKSAVASSPYPLWWGLKQFARSGWIGVGFFQPVSIMMRIETQGKAGLA